MVFEGVVNRGPCGPFYWFCQLFQNRDVLDASSNTLMIALTSTMIATVIGTMAALALQRYNFRGKLFAETSLYFPIVMPEIVMGIGILVLFQRDVWLDQQRASSGWRISACRWGWAPSSSRTLPSACRLSS